ncbi:helix-turn-helix domain-containing protein [Bifidobacterium pseudocatenulatum]|nr:helix-turn-helix domain-containing protein [Bifidobacterium pseudocatenulatum]
MTMTHDYMKSMISYLLNRRDFVSGQELSEALGVSTKTINRTVKQINESAEENPIIESQRGRGYRLNFQNYFDQRDRMDHANAMNGISSVERRDEIIKRLLITSPHQYRVDDI